MSDKEEVSEEEITDADYYLPVANVSRIMKTRLPPQGKVAKEAKEAVQECVTEFICFITSEYPFSFNYYNIFFSLILFIANDRCVQEKRKTINGDDILWAMTNLGFDRYIEPLKIYLQKYREVFKKFYIFLSFRHLNQIEDKEEWME